MAEARRIIGAMPSMNASRIGAGPAEVLDALQLLLQVEYLLAALYTRTTSATGLVPPTDAAVFSTLDTQTAQHQGRISVAITTRAGIVPPTPVFDFTVHGPNGFLRRFAGHGTAVWSLKEPWTETADPRMAELLASLYAWMAVEESRRRSERTRAGLERRKREGLPVGRQPGATDKKPRRRSGYMARWERERAAAG